MEKTYIAKMRLIAAALSYAASSAYQETAPDPGPYDDAEMEMKQAMLDTVAREYVEAIS